MLSLIRLKQVCETRGALTHWDLCLQCRSNGREKLLPRLQQQRTTPLTAALTAQAAQQQAPRYSPGCHLPWRSSQ